MIEILVVIFIAIHMKTIAIPLDNSFVVGIAAVSVFVGIVFVGIAAILFVAIVGIVGIFGVFSEFACL